MHCIYHVKMCIRHKYKNHETSHLSAAIWAKIKCLRNHLDGWLTEDGLFTLSTVKKKGGAQVDEYLQLYTLSWSFGTRNQSILSYGIKTYYKSALCQRNRNHQYSKAALSTKQLNTLQYVSLLSITVYSGSDFGNEKKERKKELFYFLCLKSNRKQASILLYTNISKVHCLYKRRTKKQKAVYRDQMWVGAHTSHGFLMILRGSHFIIAGTKQNCRVLCQVF